MSVTTGSYDPENRDVLLRLSSGGDSLTSARDVNFSVGFHDENGASNFVDQIRRLGFRVDFEFKEQFSPRPWDATVVSSLIPSEESIGDFELFLERLAAPLGGKNDGWFCERIIDKYDVSQSTEALL